ncbi:MAG: pyruvate synthase [Elusimicrobia bacterium HGW-Elusimicrobia-1]|jgi:pyruvate ferredoxin oxidoreductase gamma subunit|nr:MAG: pyruvate synthase [Elusimicrobia bacterium HGW-Elusimicrobia-1]
MSEKIIEIRWHGRGGQGAKTAALLFGEAVLSTGKYIQAFPEYGPERMGAPVQAFNRISDHPILIHSAITNPKYVIVLDETLMGPIDVTAGMGAEAVIIVNTERTKEDVAATLGLKPSQVHVINATKIARDTIGLPIPNTPMLGALVKIIEGLSLDDILDDTRKKLTKKFRHKPQVIEGNMASIKKAYDEVK